MFRRAIHGVQPRNSVAPILIGVVAAAVFYLLIRYICEHIDLSSGGRSWGWVVFFLLLGIALLAAAITSPYSIPMRILLISSGLINAYAAARTAFQWQGFHPEQDDALDGYELEGHLRPWPTKRERARILQGKLAVTIYPFAVSIDASDNFYFVYEDNSGPLQSPVIDASAYSLSKLQRDAKLVAGALEEAQIKYRFRLIDGETLVETMQNIPFD